MSPSKTDRILVVGGGGTFGSSTALHLVRNGYKNVHVIDKYAIPSAQSAGNDRNKIIAPTSINPLYDQLTKEALNAWNQDDLFTPYFHNTGKLYAVCEDEFDYLDSYHKKLLDAGYLEVEMLRGKQEIIKKAPHMKDSPIDNWRALWFPRGGWLSARDAINAIGLELQRHGVTFTSGNGGTFKEPILSQDGQTVKGVIAQDGTRHEADYVILATGSWTPSLINLQNSCVSKAWVFAHLQLTKEEHEKLKGIPVVYNPALGFTFEPSEDGVMKICDEFPGYAHFTEVKPFGSSKPIKMSVPRSHAQHPNDTYPAQSEKTIRRCISTYLPFLSDRPFFDRAMCWCADSFDGNFFICNHPNWKGLIIASGDNGTGFKYLPTIGKHIVSLMEGNLDNELKTAWRWRTPGENDNALQGRRDGYAINVSDADIVQNGAWDSGYRAKL